MFQHPYHEHIFFYKTNLLALTIFTVNNSLGYITHILINFGVHSITFIVSIYMKVQTCRFKIFCIKINNIILKFLIRLFIVNYFNYINNCTLLDYTCSEQSKKFWNLIFNIVSTDPQFHCKVYWKLVGCGGLLPSRGK